MIICCVLTFASALFLFLSYQLILPKKIRTIKITDLGIEVIEDNKIYTWQSIKWYRFDAFGNLSRDIVLGIKGNILPIKFECIANGRYAENWNHFRKGILITGKKNNPLLRNYFDSKVWEAIKFVLMLLIIFLALNILWNGIIWERVTSLLLAIFGIFQLLFLIDDNKD